ncbi:MAG: hypothetical protein OXF56_25985 [Rhodobacteraceae bacterium]|nr:hypothetical protein [Paracoccaceae bacterium]
MIGIDLSHGNLYCFFVHEYESPRLALEYKAELYEDKHFIEREVSQQFRAFRLRTLRVGFEVARNHGHDHGRNLLRTRWVAGEFGVRRIWCSD